MIAKSRPISSRRSYNRRGNTAVAKSRVFFAGWAQNASWLIRRRRRSSTDIARTPRVPPPTAVQPRTALSPPTLRSCSVKTGPYSIQWPSASIIGWSRRDLICAGVRLALMDTSHYQTAILLAQHLIGPFDERHQIGRTHEAGILAVEVGVAGRTGP